MKYEVRVDRKYSEVFSAARLNLIVSKINSNGEKINVTFVDSFPDTVEGAEQARKAYQHALEQVRAKGEVNETLFKEEVETNESK